MSVIAKIMGLVIVLSVSAYIIKTQFTRGPQGGAPPKEMIELVGVKTDLVSLGQAERLYVASHGSYASLDQLRDDGATSFSWVDRPDYKYSAEVDGAQHFKITAEPSSPAEGLPTLSIDETMQVARK
jgi:hypothetical protein